MSDPVGASMDGLLGEIRLVRGALAGRAIVQAFLGADLLFTITADTEAEAVAQARRRLQQDTERSEHAVEMRSARSGASATLPKGAAWSKEIQIQPRARLLPVPLTFYLEEGRDLRRWDAGNDSNSPSGGYHQVDPRREASWAPVMPDISLAQRTGNAYRPQYDPTRMQTTPAYRELAMVSHIVHRVLRERRSTTAAEIGPIAIEEVRNRFTDGDLKRKVPGCIRDTLRDLRLYGLAATDRPSGLARAHFSWVPPDSVETIELSPASTGL